MVHTLRLDNYSTTPRKLVLGTNSSYGTESIKIERGAGWDGLNLTATWHIPGREEPLRVALLDGDAMDVPPEVTKEAKDGVLVLAGLASGVQRASCNVEYLILEQAGVYGGADAEPTPELAAQVLEATTQAKANAEAAAQDASEAKANANKAQQAAENLQPDVNQIKEELAKKVPKSDYAPEAKTDAMTQPVGKDSDGKLWTAPGSGGGGIAVSGATVGQTIKISAVDDDGVPTAWEPVDLPSGGAENDNDWEIINTITFEEEGITSFTIDKDQNGNQFELSDMLIRSNYHASLGGTSDTSARTHFMINGKVTTYSIGNISSANRHWAAIATLINGRVYYGHSDFSSQSNANIPLSIRPMQSNLGALYNDNAITSVGINILNPGAEYFAVGYEITLWGRRKK